MQEISALTRPRARVCFDGAASRRVRSSSTRSSKRLSARRSSLSSRMVCVHSTVPVKPLASRSHSPHLMFLRRPCHPWNIALRRPVPQHQAARRERRGHRQFPPLAVSQKLLHPWFGDQICAAARFGGGHRAAAGRGAARGRAAKRRHVIPETLIISARDGNAKEKFTVCRGKYQTDL